MIGVSTYYAICESMSGVLACGLAIAYAEDEVQWRRWNVEALVSVEARRLATRAVYRQAQELIAGWPMVVCC